MLVRPTRPSGEVIRLAPWPAAAAGEGRPRGAADVPRRLLQPQRPLVELVGVLALYLLYELGRGLVVGRAHVAFRHAGEIVDVERQLHVFVEGWIQDSLEDVPGILGGLSFFYVLAHLTATAAVLLWLYLRKPEVYGRIRATLVLASFAALLGYGLFPTMPPRLAAVGLADTVSDHTPINLGSTILGRLYDPYAAVPSMHFGYALVVGLVLVRHARPLALRIAGAVYPTLVLLAIVGTGNHYFLDAAAGAVVVGLAWLAVLLLTRLAEQSAEHIELPEQVTHDARRAA